jgi:hypothetical protein
MRVWTISSPIAICLCLGLLALADFKPDEPLPDKPLPSFKPDEPLPPVKPDPIALPPGVESMCVEDPWPVNCGAVPWPNCARCFLCCAHGKTQCYTNCILEYSDPEDILACMDTCDQSAWFCKLRCNRSYEDCPEPIE